MFQISKKDQELMITFYKAINEINYNKTNEDTLCKLLYEELIKNLESEMSLIQEFVKDLENDEPDYQNTTPSCKQLDTENDSSNLLKRRPQVVGANSNASSSAIVPGNTTETPSIVETKLQQSPLTQQDVQSKVRRNVQPKGRQNGPPAQQTADVKTLNASSSSAIGPDNSTLQQPASPRQGDDATRAARSDEVSESQQVSKTNTKEISNTDKILGVLEGSNALEKYNKFEKVTDYTYDNLIENINAIISFYIKARTVVNDHKPIFISHKIKFLRIKLISCRSQHIYDLSQVPTKIDIRDSLNLPMDLLTEEYIKYSFVIVFLALLNEKTNLFYYSIQQGNLHQGNLLYYTNKYLSKYMAYKSPFKSTYLHDPDEEPDIFDYKKIKMFTYEEASMLLALISTHPAYKNKSLSEIQDLLLTMDFDNSEELNGTQETIWRTRNIKDPFIQGLGNIELSITKNLLKEKIPLEIIFSMYNNELKNFIIKFTKELKLWLMQTMIFTSIKTYYYNKYLLRQELLDFIKNKKTTYALPDMDNYDLKKKDNHDKIFPYLVVYYLLLILRARIYETILQIFISKNIYKYCDHKTKVHLDVIIKIFDFLKLFSPSDIPFIKKIFDYDYDKTKGTKKIKKKTYLEKYIKYKIKYLKLIKNHVNI